MADETVASLGFAVDSKPLDDAKQKLSDVASQAGNTGKAVDDFNQKVGKTSGEASKASDSVGKITPTLSALEAAAKRAGVSVEEMRARTAAFSAESVRLASASATAGSAIGTIAKEAGSVAPALGAVAAASAAVTKEHEAHNNALSSLRGNLKGMSPLLSQFGGGLGDLLQYSKAARLGLEGFAVVAAGAAILSLEKLGDEIERTKNRFAGLTGSVESGAKAYDAVKAAAKSSGVEFSALAGAVESAIIGQEKFADKNVIYANTAEMAAKKTAEVSAAFGTFGQIMQANLATAEQENKALKSLGESFEKTGTLTTDALQKIRQESPSTALAIANAFGSKTVKDFIAELDKAPISLDDFVKRMALVKPQIDASFNPEQPKNFEQALRGVTAASKDLLETLAQAGAFDVFKNILVGTKKEVEALSTPLETMQKAFKEAGENSSKAWGDFVSFAEDKNSIFGTSMTVNVDGAVLKALVILGRLPGEGLSAITAWANGAIGAFESFAASAVKAAQTAASAIASIVSATAGAAKDYGSKLNESINNAEGGNAYNGPQLSGTGDSGPALSSGGGASGSWDSGGATPQGTDAGAAGFDLGLSDLPAFASGGQLTVTGSGGTDTTLVQFKATPGEVVEVKTPIELAQNNAQSEGLQGVTTAQRQPSAVGVVSATPDPASLATVREITQAIDQSSIDISKRVAGGSDQIVSAINKLTGVASAPTLNPSTGLPVASAGSSATGPVGSAAWRPSLGGVFGAGLTGGGGGSKKGQKDQPESKYESAQGGQPFGTTSGLYQGQGGGVKGFKGGPAQFKSGAPTGPFAPSTNNYGGYMPLDPNLFDYLNTETGYASVGSAGDGYGDPFVSGTTPFNDYGLDYGGNTGGNFGTGGSSVGDVASQYISSGGADYTSSGGFDTSGYNSGGYGGDPYSGGGGFDAGAFATGGSFIVPGSSLSGVDKTLVKMHVTPGEQVFVVPNGMPAPPNGVTVPAMAPSNQAAVSDPSQATTTTTTTKIVNIQVQAGLQAQDFIRSRAQIARGF